VAENVKPWDNIIMAIYTLLLIVMIVVAGLDSGRFNWSPTPLTAKLIGTTGLLFAMFVIWRVMAANTYLSERVRIQEERGHKVITSGPYRYVRHPMYVGIIIAALSTPLVLDSWLALFPGGLIAILFVIRTFLEDRTLHEELAGYKDYSVKVRYRLLPGVW
jgi:protein-S-isoprenylcysteine O-methyltransferase Ste14